MSAQTTAGATAGTPTIVRVTYDPGALSLAWAGSGIGPATQCQVTLTGGALPAQYPATGTSATLNVTIPTTGAWSVSVAVVGGAASATVPVLATAATLGRVQNLGPSLDAAWTRAPGTTLSYVQLAQQGSGESQGWMTSDERLPIDQPVTGTGWQVSVRGAVTSGPATSYGPAVSAPVLTVATQLVRVANSGSGVQLVWAPLAGYTRFLAALDQGGPAVQSRSVTGNSWTFAGTLTGTGWRATVSAQSADGVSIGPPATEVAVILDAPRMSRVAYLSSSLTLTWALLEGQDGYAATLWNENQTTSQTTSQDSTSFAGPFSGTWSCAVRAQSQDQVSLGPPSATCQPILVAPTLNTFAYDGAQVAVTWTNADAPATDNLLSVAVPGSDQGASIGTSGSATVQMTLSPTTAYTAVVYATSGIVLGPPSDPLVPITAPPRAVYLGQNGTTLVGVWKAPPGVTPTGYHSVLTANGSAVDTRDDAASPQPFGIPMANATAYGLQVRAVAGSVTGPPNPPAPGPYAAAQVLSYDGFGRILGITWNGAQTVTWSYDAAGNLLSQSLSTTSTGASS
jgi:YD repeat-containing protein